MDVRFSLEWLLKGVWVSEQRGCSVVGINQAVKWVLLQPPSEQSSKYRLLQMHNDTAAGSILELGGGKKNYNSNPFKRS